MCQRFWNIILLVVLGFYSYTACADLSVPAYRDVDVAKLGARLGAIRNEISKDYGEWVVETYIEYMEQYEATGAMASYRDSLHRIFEISANRHPWNLSLPAWVGEQAGDASVPLRGVSVAKIQKSIEVFETRLAAVRARQTEPNAMPNFDDLRHEEEQYYLAVKKELEGALSDLESVLNHIAHYDRELKPQLKILNQRLKNEGFASHERTLALVKYIRHGDLCARISRVI